MVMCGAATVSPSRPTNSERPFTIASPPSALPIRPSSERVTSGSSTTGRRHDDGWRAPRSRTARVAASRAASSTSSSEKVRAAEKPLPVRVSAPSPAIAYAEIEHIVRRVRASTPLEFATALSIAPSP